jgi:hypothetical protein
MDAPSRKRGNEEGTVYNARTGPPELGWWAPVSERVRTGVRSG